MICTIVQVQYPTGIDSAVPYWLPWCSILYDMYNCASAVPYRNRYSSVMSYWLPRFSIQLQYITQWCGKVFIARDQTSEVQTAKHQTSEVQTFRRSAIYKSEITKPLTMHCIYCKIKFSSYFYLTRWRDSLVYLKVTHVLVHISRVIGSLVRMRSERRTGRTTSKFRQKLEADSDQPIARIALSRTNLTTQL